jgi:hypothetical protein
MNYVFDTGSFIELERFYPNVFKSVWVKLDELVEKGMFLSTREVWNELERGDLADHLNKWIENKGRDRIFTIPTSEELQFVSKILSIEHFKALIGSKQQLRGSPVADPFVIACANDRKGTVVTQERYKPNAPKIPNICEYFSIPCMDLEKFMQAQKWEF